jgi:hypothetical protein
LSGPCHIDDNICAPPCGQLGNLRDGVLLVGDDCMVCSELQGDLQFMRGSGEVSDNDRRGTGNLRRDYAR